MKRPNLTVEIRALALRVIFDGKRAIGLEYRQDGVIRRARARREVLLAGGSLQSPQLLQLSGVGPAGLLKEHGIDIVHELAGVGENLQDHIGCKVIYKVKKANTINEISRSWWRQGRAGLEYILAGKGTLMMGAAPIGLFARTRPGSASPDCQYQFLAGSLDAPGAPMHSFPACQMTCIPCRPESRGWLRIKSSDPTVLPAMQPNYLATQNDRDTLIAGMRVARSIFQTPTMKSITTEEFWPGAGKDSDEDWLEHAKNTGYTTFHQTSTCMMGNGPMSVVDNELRVRDMEGLRVVDASVMPTVISGNTNAATIMIAEKAADMIRAESRATAKAA
jgi:choline dehydrogenase